MGRGTRGAQGGLAGCIKQQAMASPTENQSSVGTSHISNNMLLARLLSAWSRRATSFAGLIAVYWAGRSAARVKHKPTMAGGPNAQNLPAGNLSRASVGLWRSTSLGMQRLPQRGALRKDAVPGSSHMLTSSMAYTIPPTRKRSPPIR